MSIPSTSRLLAFARDLQRASTFEELLETTRAEIQAAIGYNQAWLFVAEDESLEELRLIDLAGSKREMAWEVSPLLKVKGDPMLEEMVSGDHPVVVSDARTDPRTNKDIVAQMGNRTIVNLPLRLLDKPFGAFGTGTFGDAEGCRPPTPEQLDYLIGMASQLAVAAGRIRFLEERKRSAELLAKTEDQLRQAQKMEAIGRLAGGVAHDFNNLLSVVLSYSELLLTGMDEADARRADLEQIQLAAQRASELTRQLLAFGRQQVLEPKVLDLRAIVAGLEPMLRRLIPADIDLRIAHVGQVGRIRADPNQIEQIVINLAVNARDAMPRGGGLTIETGHVDLDERYAREHVGSIAGPHVMLAISDTGGGMDKATQARIFDPFFTTKEKGKGTGLGLATVYGIVQQSGGSIWVYSEPGAGATFKVYFPTTDQPIEVWSSPLETANTEGTEAILVVEDEEQVRQVVCNILRRNGYTVIEAAGAQEALSHSADPQTHIDLLLTDVVMPGMGARELVRAVQLQRPELPVLYMSGYTENAIVHHGVLDSGVMLLQKPITPEALGRKVRHVLDAAAASRAAIP